MIESRTLFRNGILNLIELSHEYELPFYVVSAGVKGLIHEAFDLVAQSEEAKTRKGKGSSGHLMVISNEL
jgi:2-hydroxy-3-keto-5-methylthiopentenyl-1-phosphate phosphatase